MKLRIKDNSVRFRLSQSEIAELAKSFLVESELTFSDGDKILYRLQLTDTFQFTKNGNVIAASVPMDIGKNWVDSNDVGIEHVFKLKKGDLFLLIEKDFKCLTDRPREDESDLFDNPASAAC